MHPFLLLLMLAQAHVLPQVAVDLCSLSAPSPDPSAMLIPPDPPAMLIPPDSPAMLIPPDPSAMLIPPDPPAMLIPPDSPAMLIPPDPSAMLIPPDSPAMLIPPESPSRPDHTVIIHTPVGRQFLLVGLQTGFWLGSGTVTALTPEGDLGPEVGRFSDNAYSVGPVFVGLMHVITRRIFFEARFGAGAVWFPNDRLVSGDLSAQGDNHLGLIFGAEIRARTVTRDGLTASFGLNLNRVGLPDSSGGYLGVSPALGYLSWEEGYDGLWLVELGYTYPLINGLAPEVAGAGLNEPIDSRWHIFTLTTQIGL